MVLFIFLQIPHLKNMLKSANIPKLFRCNRYVKEVLSGLESSILEHTQEHKYKLNNW